MSHHHARHRKDTSPLRLSPVAAAGAVALALLAAPMSAQAAGVLATGGGPLVDPPQWADVATSDADSSIATLALAQLGDDLNGPNTVDGRGFLASAALPGAWCAEFAAWVWAENGVNPTGLNGWAGSFVSYGQEHGTFHSGNPRVGDAAVFSLSQGASTVAATGGPFQLSDIEHVGLVVAVTDTTVTVVNGDWGDGRGGPQLVRLSTFSRAASDAGDYAPDMLQFVAGYIDPVGGRAGALAPIPMAAPGIGAPVAGEPGAGTPRVTAPAPQAPRAAPAAPAPAPVPSRTSSPAPAHAAAPAPAPAPKPTSAPTPKSTPTSTPAPKAAPAPTSAPKPSSTATPTSTPSTTPTSAPSTSTPAPTSTPRPTSTPDPTSTPTGPPAESGLGALLQRSDQQLTESVGALTGIGL